MYEGFKAQLWHVKPAAAEEEGQQQLQECETVVAGKCTKVSYTAAAAAAVSAVLCSKWHQT